MFLVWKVRSANYRIMRGYGVLTGYAFDLPVLETDRTFIPSSMFILPCIFCKTVCFICTSTYYQSSVVGASSTKMKTEKGHRRRCLVENAAVHCLNQTMNFMYVHLLEHQSQKFEILRFYGKVPKNNFKKQPKMRGPYLYLCFSFLVTLCLMPQMAYRFAEPVRFAEPAQVLRVYFWETTPLVFTISVCSP